MNVKARSTDHHSLSRRSLGLLMVGGAAGRAVADPTATPSPSASGPAARRDDLTQIEQLHHRHSKALDQRDVQALIECFAPGVLSPTIAQKVITFFRRFEYTLHNVVNPVYGIDGESAAGTAVCIVSFVRNDGGKRTAFDTISQYRDDRLTRHDGRWLFLRHHRTSLYSTKAIEVIEGDPPEVTKAVREIFG